MPISAFPFAPPDPPGAAVAAGADRDGTLDALLEPHLRDAVAALDGGAPLLAGMARYHLGTVDPRFHPVAPGQVDRGKRVRPAVALLSCAAAGGDPAAAAPLGAALELLHNFTLIHDDIQDQSPSRRHRPTVWSQWGAGQAINAGDALFAAAHLPLYRLRDGGAPASLVLRVLEGFDRMTIEIVRGQTLDLGFEGRPDVTADDYLAMIAGKTAAIVCFAAAAGALLGGADEAESERFGAFGLALGLGFQVRDDALGIWGSAAATGKVAADDIRRRKQALPALLLRERLAGNARAELDALYGAPDIDDRGIARVLALMAETGVRAAVEERVAAYHDLARRELIAAARPGPNAGRDSLLALVDGLAGRPG